MSVVVVPGVSRAEAIRCVSVVVFLVHHLSSRGIGSSPVASQGGCSSRVSVGSLRGVMVVASRGDCTANDGISCVWLLLNDCGAGWNCSQVYP